MSDDNVRQFRPLVITSEMPGEKKRTVFDAAREVLAHYEKAYKDQPVPRIFLVIDAPLLTVGHAGERCRPTEAAGLLTGASHLLLTNLSEPYVG